MIIMEIGTAKKNYFNQRFLIEDHNGLLKLIHQIPQEESLSGCMNLKLLHAGAEYL